MHCVVNVKLTSFVDAYKNDIVACNKLQIHCSIVSGDWTYVGCNETFIHFQRVQDVRLSSQLNVNCYCVLFDPNLTPRDLVGSQVVFRKYVTGIWEEVFTISYDDWASTSTQYPQFKVQQDSSVLVPTLNGETQEDLDNNVNIHVGKASKVKRCRIRGVR